MPKEKEFYVGITRPVESRKALLETSKEVIRALQGFERIRQVRDQKTEQIARLSNLISDISSSLEQVKANLPEYAQEDFPKPQAQKGSTVVPEQKIIKRPKLNDVQQLELDLNSIEEKLKRL